MRAFLSNTQILLARRHLIVLSREGPGSAASELHRKAALRDPPQGVKRATRRRVLASPGSSYVSDCGVAPY